MEAFLGFTEKWEKRYPAIIKLWDNAWAEFVPFLQFGACRRIAGCVRVTELSCVGALIRWDERPGFGSWGLSGGGCAVDLHEVEGAGGELEFAEGGIQSAAGEPVEDLLQVSDCWFDGGAAPLVEGSPLLGS